MKSSTKRILTIIFAAGFFVLTLIVYGNFIRPQMTEIDAARTELASKQNLFENQTTVVTQVQNVIAQFQNAARVRETVSMAVPQYPNTTGLLNQMYSIALNNQVQFRKFEVSVDSFRPNDVFFVKRLGVLKIKTTLAGNYEGLKNFLKSLERNVRVMNVKSVEFGLFKQSGGAQLAGIYEMNLEVETYYQEQ